MELEVSPAYGRDYKSKAAALADWNADKDFVVETFGRDMGRYVNRPQVPGVEVWIRFARKTKVVQAQ